MSKFILPFKGRNSVNAYNQNFLWNHDRVYIMDNHRAALWCWLQEMSDERTYSMFHIDMHYDLHPGVDNWLPKNLPDLATISFEDYLGLSRDDGESIPLIIYDNYLSIFEECYRHSYKYFFAATQEVGTPPSECSPIEHIRVGDLVEYLRSYLYNDDLAADGWIVNLDLDYFFARQPTQHKVLFSDSYIDEVFGAIADAYNDGRISCLTVALSPECCGGWDNWDNSEAMCKRFVDTLGIDFQLPR